MLVDANILLYAVDSASRYHDRAREWLETVLNGDRPVGIPWSSIGAFLRIASHPRAARNPLDPGEAWEHVAAWLATPVAWVPPATERTAAILGRLVTEHGITGNLVPDAQLAALALEHGLTICSADSDFARFTKVRWKNPLAVP